MIIVGCHTEEVWAMAQRLRLPRYRVFGTCTNSCPVDGLNAVAWAREGRGAAVSLVTRKYGPAYKYIVGPGWRGDLDGVLRDADWPMLVSYGVGVRPEDGRSYGLPRSTPKKFFFDAADWYRGDLSWPEAIGVSDELSHEQMLWLHARRVDVRGAEAQSRASADDGAYLQPWHCLGGVPRAEDVRRGCVDHLVEYFIDRFHDQLVVRGYM